MVIRKKKLVGKVTVMGDKSISHRFAMFAALAQGSSTAQGFLLGEDCLATLSCLSQLGISHRLNGTTLTVTGGGLHSPTLPLNAANSGTTMRLLSGLLCGLGVAATIIGDTSLSRRPMLRVVEPLRLMGGNITASNNGTAPITIKKSTLQGINYTLPVESAQLKSAIILAALGAKGVTTVCQCQPIRNHTENMLKAMGAGIFVNGFETKVVPGHKLSPLSIQIPGDISSAAYFIAGAVLLKGSHIVVENVGLNPTRMGFVYTLQRMGANIEIEVTQNGVEPIGNITVKHSSLTAVQVEKAHIPAMIDEVTLLTLVSVFANGKTVIYGVDELKHKESDRLFEIVNQLKAAGGDVLVRGDSIIINGTGSLLGKCYHSRGDHRLAMTFYVASLLGDTPSTVEGGECVSISFPSFYDIFKSIEEV